MAGFRTHITVSTLCGAGYGIAAYKVLGHQPESAMLAAGLTAVGGMLPDLDSDSGVPVREMSGLAAAVIPLLLFNRLVTMGMTHEGVLAALVGLYLFMRYGAAYIFKHVTVHRGMFHSIPAMLIAGLVVYLEYESPNRSVRILLACGVMIGFLSHLLLDEIYSVDFNGIRLKVKASSGTAVKFVSGSIAATAVCYGLLGVLIFLAYAEFKGKHPNEPVDIRRFVSNMK